MASNDDSDVESDHKLEGILKLSAKNISSPFFSYAETARRIGKLNWKFFVKIECSEHTSNVKYLCVYVRCNSDSESLIWSCTCTVDFVLLNPTGDDFLTVIEREIKSVGGVGHGLKTFIKLDDVRNPDNGYITNDCIELEARVKIYEVQGFRIRPLVDFMQEYPSSDGVLLVENLRVHVVKSYLSLHSPFFSSLFSENFSEGKMDEIPLKDIKCNEFVELLHIIYPSRKRITAKNVEYILQLSDRFQMQNVIDLCEQYLITSDDVPLIKKFLFAGRYLLSELEDACVKKLTVTQIVKLKKEKDFESLNYKTKLAMFEKMITLSK